MNIGRIGNQPSKPDNGDLNPQNNKITKFEKVTIEVFKDKYSDFNNDREMGNRQLSEIPSSSATVPNQLKSLGENSTNPLPIIDQVSEKTLGEDLLDLPDLNAEGGYVLTGQEGTSVQIEEGAQETTEGYQKATESAQEATKGQNITTEGAEEKVLVSEFDKNIIKAFLNFKNELQIEHKFYCKDDSTLKGIAGRELEKQNKPERKFSEEEAREIAIKIFKKAVKAELFYEIDSDGKHIPLSKEKIELLQQSFQGFFVKYFLLQNALIIPSKQPSEETHKHVYKLSSEKALKLFPYDKDISATQKSYQGISNKPPAPPLTILEILSNINKKIKEKIEEEKEEKYWDDKHVVLLKEILSREIQLEELKKSSNKSHWIAFKVLTDAIYARLVFESRIAT